MNFKTGGSFFPVLPTLQITDREGKAITAANEKKRAIDQGLYLHLPMSATFSGRLRSNAPRNKHVWAEKRKQERTRVSGVRGRENLGVAKAY